MLNWLLAYLDDELMVTKQRQEDLRNSNIFNTGSDYDYDNFNNPYPQTMDIEGWKTLRDNWRNNYFVPAKQKYNSSNTGWPKKTQYILVAIRAGGQALYYHEIFVDSLAS